MPYRLEWRRCGSPNVSAGSLEGDSRTTADKSGCVRYVLGGPLGWVASNRYLQHEKGLWGYGWSRGSGTGVLLRDVFATASA